MTALKHRLGSFEIAVLIFIGVSFLARAFTAYLLPMSGDEALYWTYSKNLAFGYLDHPGMNAFMIRIGTFVFGDTPFGARIATLLISLPATWAMWVSAQILFKSARMGAVAALLFTLTVAISVGSFIATSDALVMAASSFILYFLVKLMHTGQGKWWIAIGIAIGLGMLSKYTTVFLVFGLLVWLVLSKRHRKWLINPWSLAGGLISALIFAPVIMWNIEHDWISLVYQSSRMVVHDWTLKFFGEFILSQVGFLTPPIFILGCIGLFSALKSNEDNRDALILIVCLTVPIFAYFAWHSLHGRVQGNWLQAGYPAFVMAATFAVHTWQDNKGEQSASPRRVTQWSYRLAAPFGAGLALLIYVQACFGVFHIGRKDPATREIAHNFAPISMAVEQERVSHGVPVIITSDYTTLAWLRFYGAKSAPIYQITEAVRWINEPKLGAATFEQPLIYVCRDGCSDFDDIQAGFNTVEVLQTLTRTRDGKPIETYTIMKVHGPKVSVYDMIDKPITKGRRVKQD